MNRLRLLCLGKAVISVAATTSNCPKWYRKQDRKKAGGATDISVADRNEAFDFYGAYDLNMQEPRVEEAGEDGVPPFAFAGPPSTETRLSTSAPGAAKLQVYGATAHAVQYTIPEPDYPQLYDGLVGRWDGTNTNTYGGTSVETPFNGLDHTTSACPWYQMQLVPSTPTPSEDTPGVAVGTVRIWFTGGNWSPIASGDVGTTATLTGDNLDRLKSLFQKDGLRVKVGKTPRVSMSEVKNKNDRSYDICEAILRPEDEVICDTVTPPPTLADAGSISSKTMSELFPYESVDGADDLTGLKVMKATPPGSTEAETVSLFEPIHPVLSASFVSRDAGGSSWDRCSREMFYVDVDCLGKEANYVIVEFPGVKDPEAEAQREFDCKKLQKKFLEQDGAAGGGDTWTADFTAWNDAGFPWYVENGNYASVNYGGNPAAYQSNWLDKTCVNGGVDFTGVDSWPITSPEPRNLRAISTVDEIEVYAPAVQCATGEREYSLAGQQKKCYPNVCDCPNGVPLVTSASSGEVCKEHGRLGCKRCHLNFVPFGADCREKQLCAAAFGGASGPLSCPVGKVLTPDASARCRGQGCTVANDAATCCQIIGSCGSGFRDGCPTQAALLSLQMCANAEACTAAECCQPTCAEADADSSVRESCRAAESAGAGVRGFAQWKLCPADGSACNSAEYCCVTAEEGTSEDLRARMQNLRVTLSTSTLSSAPEFATLMDEVGTNEATAATFFRLVENGVRTLHKQPEVVVPWLTDAGVPTAFLMQQANLVKITGSQSEVVATFPASDSSRTRSRSRNLLHADRGLSAASASSYAVHILSYGLYLEDGVVSSTAELEAALERFQTQLTAAGVAEAFSAAFAADSSNTFHNTEVTAASVTGLPTRVAPQREVESTSTASSSSSTTSSTTEKPAVVAAPNDDGTVYVDEDNAWWVAVLVVVAVVLAFFGGSYVKSGTGGGWAQSSWSQAGRGSSWAGPRKGGGSYGHWNKGAAPPSPWQVGSTSHPGASTAWGKSASSPGRGRGPKGKGGPSASYHASAKDGKWSGGSP